MVDDTYAVYLILNDFTEFSDLVINCENFIIIFLEDMRNSVS